MAGYATVDCDLCRREFCASTIETAMRLMQEHKDRDHYKVREPQASEVLTLNMWDRNWLFWVGISAE